MLREHASGPYELLALVGAGGMGEVYRARDTRLGRTVAVKVLAGSPADRERLRARFDREARVVSFLNHPNICALYDLGRTGEIDFLVMEFVEGQTLAARLARGPLPMADVLRVAIEIADALARAHAAGAVHRDLKPANIMLTPGVKLLDFGIAAVAPIEDPGDAPTREALQSLTGDGEIVGTIQYMAPEQLEGKRVDPRTDIFAFGAVMYEAITGRPAFGGSSSAAIIAAIFSATPPTPASLAPQTPVALDRLVMACLSKTREDRWQSSADLVRELRWMAQPSGEEAGRKDGALQNRRSRMRTAALVTASLVAGAVLGAGLMPRGRSSNPPASDVIRFPIALAPGDTLAFVAEQSAGPALGLSPDGSTLAYVISRNGRTQLMLHTLDGRDSTVLPGTEGASQPFFSPDGEWIGFIAGETLKKVAVSGGAPLVLTTVPPVTRGAAWSRDGTIYLSPSFADRIFKLPEAGGTLVPVTSFDAGEANHLLPHVLPDGRALVFTAWTGGSFTDASLSAWSLATGRRRKLLDAASNGRYAPPGHLIFAQGDALLAVPFDPLRAQVTGSPVPVADDVEINPANGTAQFALSATGTLVYATRGTKTVFDLAWVDRHGAERRLPFCRGDLETPRLSPDGRSVAFQALNDIWICDLGTGRRRRLTFGGVNQGPVWTPDGSRVAFSRPGDGTPPALFWTAADGSGQAEPMAAPNKDEVSFPSDWSPDGTDLAFSRALISGTKWDVMAWHRRDRTTSAVEQTPFNDVVPAFSPDGKWLAYVSDVSGRFEVYVRPYAEAGPGVPVSSDGGTEPRWGPDGKELFYVRGGMLVRVAVQTAPVFRASRPDVLFAIKDRRTMGSPGFTRFDVAPDGRHFLMILPVETSPVPSRFVVVLGQPWNSRARRPGD